jgi:hypothetical protein
LGTSCKNPFVSRAIALSSMEYPVTAKSARVDFPLYLTGEKRRMKWAMPNWRGGTGDTHFSVSELDGMGMAKGTERMGVSSGRSVIDCPSNHGLAAMTKNDGYRIANDVRLGTELPREVLRNGKVDVTTKNSISKTQDRSPA